MWDVLLDILFPLRCAGCGIITRHGMLCSSCRGEIHIHSSLFCGACKARLPEMRKVCHKETPFLLAAATDYTDTARSLVTDLKFRGVRSAGESLGSLMVEYLDRFPQFEGKWLVIPVPLGKKRLKIRGFNQAELLARIVAGHLKLPIKTDLLERVSETKPQTEVENRKERLENLTGVFEAKPHSYEDFSIILVDDVSTSGATLTEAAHALRKAGAKQIIGLVAAKA